MSLVDDADETLTKLGLILLKADTIIQLLETKVLHNQGVIAAKEDRNMAAINDLKSALDKLTGDQTAVIAKLQGELTTANATIATQAAEITTLQGQLAAVPSDTVLAELTKEATDADAALQTILNPPPATG